MRFCLYVLALFLLFGGPASGQDRTLEMKIEKAFNAGELAGLHSVLIEHKGDVLAELYFDGEDERWGRPLGVRTHTADGLHDLRSVSKSVTSLIYGIALEEGLVPGLDEHLVAQFPDLSDLADDPARARILVRHALSMRMGTKWNEELPYSDPRNSEVAMEQAADRYRFVLDRPMVDEPGKKWVYNGGATAVIARLIADGTGMSIDDYAQAKLFKPLGIERHEWVAGRDGVPAAASGLRLTLRDMAKIGRLVLDGGTWAGRQVVPAAWLEASLTPHAEAEGGLRYGYFWWLAAEGDPPHWVAGFGNGGQRLMVSQANDLIIAVFAGNYNQPDAWQLPVKIITEFAAPAIRAR